MKRSIGENVGRSLVAIGGLLFLLAMFLPWFDFFGGQPGLYFLVYGPVSLDRTETGEASIFVAWLANPLCLVALYQVARGRPDRAAVIMAVALACIGITMLNLSVTPDEEYWFEPLLAGAGVWLGSLVLVLAGSTIAALSTSRPATVHPS